jgi:hypothetical protein
MNARTSSILIAGLVIAGLILWTHPHRTASHHPATAGDDSGSTSTLRVSLPRLPAPRIHVSAPAPEEIADTLPRTNILARLLNSDGTFMLTPEQVEGYLKDNHRSVESLLGAFRTTNDKSLLKEAEEKFPKDPRVAFAAATQSDSPEERRKWMDAFKQSSPDNALPNLLSASDYFKSGQNDQALQDVMSAAGKPIQDYELDFLQSSQEAFLAAGYSPDEAKTMASMSLLLPQVKDYKQVALSLADLAKSYQQAGDPASAQASLQLAFDLGGRVNTPDSATLIQVLVGNAMERIALGGMDPNAIFGGGNQTVQSQIDVLNQQRAALKALNDQWLILAPLMSNQDVRNFEDRRWFFGEQAAEQWAVDKYGQPAGH